MAPDTITRRPAALRSSATRTATARDQAAEPVLTPGRSAARAGDTVLPLGHVLAVLALASLLCWLVPDDAGAQSPASCPAAAPTPDPSDAPEVAQLKQLRADVVTTCEAVSDRLDVLDTGQTAVRGHLDDQTSLLGSVDDRLAGTLTVEQAGDGPTGPTGPQGTQEQPEWVRLAGVDGHNLSDSRWLLAFGAGLLLASGVAAIIGRAWGLR